MLYIIKLHPYIPLLGPPTF